MFSLPAGSVPCIHVFLDEVARVHKKYTYLYNTRTKRMNIKKAIELQDVVGAYSGYVPLRVMRNDHLRCILSVLPLQPVPEIQEYLALFRGD